MVIERTSTEIILKLSNDFDKIGLQRILNYLKYKEIIKESSGSEENANELALESKKRWWTENKDRFIK